MKKLVPCLVIMFAFGSTAAFAQTKDAKKPTAAECKKDPKMAGCDAMKKDEKK